MTGFMGPAWHWYLAALALTVALLYLAGWYQDRPATPTDAMLDQIDENIRSGRCTLVSGPVIDFGDTAWNDTSSALAADTHWEGLEQEWLDYVKGLPTTRETV